MTVLPALISTFWYDPAKTKEILELVLPAETALLGSALGFYFGSKQKDS